MTIKSRKEAITATIPGRIQSDPELLAELSFIYFQYFGESICSTCPNKIAGYIQKLKIKNIKPMAKSKTSKASKWSMKKGFSISYKGAVKTNATISDAWVEKYLKECPHQAKFFIKNPDAEKKETAAAKKKREAAAEAAAAAAEAAAAAAGTAE